MNQVGLEEAIEAVFRFAVSARPATHSTWFATSPCPSDRSIDRSSIGRFFMVQLESSDKPHDRNRQNTRGVGPLWRQNDMMKRRSLHCWTPRSLEICQVLDRPLQMYLLWRPRCQSEIIHSNNHTAVLDEILVVGNGSKTGLALFLVWPGARAKSRFWPGSCTTSQGRF